MGRFFIVVTASLVCIAAIHCSQEAVPERAQPAESAAAAADATPGASGVPATPDDLPRALVLALARFPERGQGPTEPLPARMEFLSRSGGEWKMSFIDDPDAKVFHKAMAYPMPDGSSQLLSAAGSGAALKLWRGDHAVATLWEADFGGKFSRMRDFELGDVYGDGVQTLAVATHDQGIVATVRPDGSGGFEVVELGREQDTFVHEIELGDLDGDGVLEVYSTPSEPNRLDGSEQSGRVDRYVPARDKGREVAADLGNRHAKEILVDDVDGDGRDELYVVVEGEVNAQTRALDKGVEIRRYEAGTDPAAKVVVGELRDRLSRFLTVGDLDGDGRKEMVVAAFSSGLWLMRPGSDPMAPWQLESIDRDSGGFEHAALLTDLDGDGTDELYVASDNDKQVRRYVWDGSKLVREVIYSRPANESVFTWNIMPIPAELVP